MKLNKIIRAFEKYQTLDSEQVKNLRLTQPDIEQLTRLGFISQCFVNDIDCGIHPTQKLWQYSFDRKQEFRKALLKNTFNFGMAVLSAVCGSAATLLLQYVFLK